MNPPHSPGPWAIDHLLSAYDRSIIARVDGIAISANISGPHISDSERARQSIYNHEGFPETSMANARLIAAAPELLAALIRLENRAAHAGFNGEDAHTLDFKSLTQARQAIAKATVGGVS